MPTNTERIVKLEVEQGTMKQVLKEHREDNQDLRDDLHEFKRDTKAFQKEVREKLNKWTGGINTTVMIFGSLGTITLIAIAIYNAFIK